MQCSKQIRFYSYILSGLFFPLAWRFISLRRIRELGHSGGKTCPVAKNRLGIVRVFDARLTRRGATSKGMPPVAGFTLGQHWEGVFVMQNNLMKFGSASIMALVLAAVSPVQANENKVTGADA